MALRAILETIRRRQASPTTSFPIEPSHVLGGSSGDASAFTPGQTYLELRCRQMFLQYEREGWREFNPLGSFLVEFLFAGAKHTVPFVLGPERLEGAPKVKDDTRIEYQNIRVAGPFPYAGDDLRLFAGLFRMETGNWAKQALSLLETVAKAFDATKLTSYLNIATPLVNGLQGLLGMDEVELRMGVDRAYTEPPKDAVPDARSHGALRPAFEVLLNLASDQVSEDQRRNFWVRDGRLCYGQDQGALQEYRGADFLLVEISSHSTRGDYTTFDFHTSDWAMVEEHLVNGREDDAWQRFRLLATNLVQCDDLVPPHREALLRQYRSWFEERRALYQELLERPAEHGFESARPPEITEADVQGALEGGARGATLATPERTLAWLDG
jgi:hypothetical protein